MKKLYAHFDIEADGENRNMIQLGISFCDETAKEIHSFLANIKPKQGIEPDPICLTEFWYKNEEMKIKYEEIIKTGRPTEVVMFELFKLLNTFSKIYKIVWVARPAS